MKKQPRLISFASAALTHLALASLAMAASPTTAPAPSAGAVRLVRHEQTIDVLIDGRPFTTYHFADDFIRPYTRPFFWPVRAPDGTELTNDQAQTVPAHAHQRSIWIGHGDVNGADHWKVTHKPLQPKQRHVDFKDVGADGFSEDLVWEDKDGQPLMGELRTCRFIAYPDGPRGLDVSVRLTALAGDVTFGTGRDHGFFSIRFLPVIGDHATFLNSERKADGAVSGQRADWCDEMGQIDGKTYGAAILDAPGNVRHPPYWHAHEGDRLMPDIFGPGRGARSDAMPDAGPLTLKGGQTLSLHWRAVFHDGDANGAAIADKYRAFVNGR